MVMLVHAKLLLIILLTVRVCLICFSLVARETVYRLVRVETWTLVFIITNHVDLFIIVDLIKNVVVVNYCEC